jgi:hypothetical protein
MRACRELGIRDDGVQFNGRGHLGQFITEAQFVFETAICHRHLTDDRRVTMTTAFEEH